MKTLIFCHDHEEAQEVQEMLGGIIISHPDHLKIIDSHDIPIVDNLLICFGDDLLEGWSLNGPASVLFSKNFTPNENVRDQARARVRTPLVSQSYKHTYPNSGLKEPVRSLGSTFSGFGLLRNVFSKQKDN